jgi:hypothetical protein
LKDKTTKKNKKETKKLFIYFSSQLLCWDSLFAAKIRLRKIWMKWKWGVIGNGRKLKTLWKDKTTLKEKTVFVGWMGNELRLQNGL